MCFQRCGNRAVIILAVYGSVRADTVLIGRAELCAGYFEAVGGGFIGVDPLAARIAENLIAGGTGNLAPAELEAVFRRRRHFKILYGRKSGLGGSG